ncbi:unnamed protein product [Protopolystoma xenopodis]|uniref:Uncharacterized protein n=1 Tax=Protopolystoma xenopodis TaxID=117903 RepID=A0A3S5FGZ7_9PLAT|nr:unnamed protein product [Protopolystoma xenopodis]
MERERDRLESYSHNRAKSNSSITVSSTPAGGSTIGPSRSSTLPPLNGQSGGGNCSPGLLVSGPSSGSSLSASLGGGGGNCCIGSAGSSSNSVGGGGLGSCQQMGGGRDIRLSSSGTGDFGPANLVASTKMSGGGNNNCTVPMINAAVNPSSTHAGNSTNMSISSGGVGVGGGVGPSGVSGGGGYRELQPLGNLGYNTYIRSSPHHFQTSQINGLLPTAGIQLLMPPTPPPPPSPQQPVLVLPVQQALHPLQPSGVRDPASHDGFVRSGPVSGQRGGRQTTGGLHSAPKGHNRLGCFGANNNNLSAAQPTPPPPPLSPVGCCCCCNLWYCLSNYSCRLLVSFEYQLSKHK